MTSELTFIYQSLGYDVPRLKLANGFKEYILSEQNPDGSWSLAPGAPGDVSVSSEAYLALKILGVPTKAIAMCKAKDFIRSAGGVARVRMLTRIFFAEFGLYPWSALPQMPCEFILIPSFLPTNIYKLSAWARPIVVALLLVFHHQPVYTLPNARDTNNDFLDELWLDPRNKHLPYPTSPYQAKDDIISSLFTVVDIGLRWLGGLRWVPLVRSYSRQRCLDWLLERQETEGDWAGVIPAMLWATQALVLEGFALTDGRITTAIEAIERFIWDGGVGKQLQATISPVWDTALMTIALCEAGSRPSDNRLGEAVRWLKHRQILHADRGDWRVYNPDLSPGGFSFEYFNTWFPDCDDTAVVIKALIRQNPDSVSSPTITKAVLWLCGMQNDDGGWAAFDTKNDELWLNKIPFSDMDALCDPSSPDVAGSVLEAFGLLQTTASENKMPGRSTISQEISQSLSAASNRALQYLANSQLEDGSWYGRWGVNYIYGTSRVLWALSYHDRGEDKIRHMVRDAIHWLKSVQNLDGGWGEDIKSYARPSLAGRGESTPSQTSWALMALLTACTPDDNVVVTGVKYLLDSQSDRHSTGAGIVWMEHRYTGTGFPNFFYMGYTGYRICFPLMALGRYISCLETVDLMDHGRLTTAVKAEEIKTGAPSNPP
ncbi:hypothetical protein VPNG_08043 [Cytospora leucostoma]|uniref:Terpene cyclase/mutase family member n=1 Tax=Cytospora leucostoma TaxID=1230097 RepID=A0A423WR05_9PEZI|nr:hypothetical protein VPNG_08043 [Cytospora leucostoma]